MSEEQLVYKKKKKKFKIFPIVNAIFFILVSLLILFPMWKVIVDSFDAHSATSFRWWPNLFSVGGYNAIFTRTSLELHNVLDLSGFFHIFGIEDRSFAVVISLVFYADFSAYLYPFFGLVLFCVFPFAHET